MSAYTAHSQKIFNALILWVRCLKVKFGNCWSMNTATTVAASTFGKIDKTKKLSYSRLGPAPKGDCRFHISWHWQIQTPQLGGNSRFPSLPLPSLLFPPPFLPFPLPLLRSRPLKYSWGLGVGSAVNSLSGVWGRAPAEIEFGAF